MVGGYRSARPASRGEGQWWVRLVSAGGIPGTLMDAPSTSLSSTQYIVDARNEDRTAGDDDGEAADLASSAEEQSATVTDTFRHVSNDGWAGLLGQDTVPSWAEWQNTLTNASGGGTFLAYGLGPTLAHFPPERLAGLSLRRAAADSGGGGGGGGGGGVRLALLVGRSSTEGSMRRLAKLANKKTASQLQLEQCVETSVLMTLAGVDSIVVRSCATVPVSASVVLFSDKTCPGILFPDTFCFLLFLFFCFRFCLFDTCLFLLPSSFCLKHVSFSPLPQLNGWASSLTANRRLVLRLMASLTGGKSIGESLAEAMEKESGVGGGGSSGNSSKANSRPSSKGKGGGKKKEAKVVKNNKAGGAEEQKPARLKWRVKANALVFGLPHVVVKK